jgi:Spy/CpxP family protein refolding chaperone
MKKLAFVLIIAVFAIGSAFAQPGGGGFGGDPAQRLQREVDGLKTALSLTDDQVTKVTPILSAASTKQREEMQKMFEGGGFDREKMTEMRTKMQAETDGLLKAVLTPEQVTKLATYRKTQAEEMAKRMQQMGGGN